MKNTFNMDLAVEESVTKWLEKNYFATNWWEGQYEIIDDMSNQHRGIDLKLRNEKIFGDSYKYNVDIKTATSYIKTSLKDNQMPTFAFELNYVKGCYEKEGWLYGDKYNSTEYYLLNWLWADIAPRTTSVKTQYSANGNKSELISCPEKINKSKSLLISKHNIQTYLSQFDDDKDNFKQKGNNMRNKYCQCKKYKKEEIVPGVFIGLSNQLVEKPVNIILNKNILFDLGIQLYNNLDSQKYIKRI